MLKHVTITLTDEVFRWAKLKAAGENTSLSRLVGRMLEEQMRMTDEYRKAGVLIECLTKQGFDDGLPAHVEAGGAFIELPQHALRQIHVDPAHRAHYGELIGKELRDILSASCLLGNLGLFESQRDMSTTGPPLHPMKSLNRLVHVARYSKGEAAMRRVEQLEQRITELDAAELKELRAWFERYDNEVWDREIENDSKNGKLRRLIDQALADDREGRSTEL